MKKPTIEKINKKVDRLLCEYSRRIVQKEGELKILLIDFTREYNEIWNQIIK